ncbi:metalloprotease TIKI2 [Notechis scutatus]|uniref:Metalloprotease TIKI n=1 Tax=Notechis scutatus TaxID=8663 RepID=A0A6J1TSS5_9SAUR|nr:metalloprotease TIKI2 [Notechis scutatus]
MKASGTTYTLASTLGSKDLLLTGQRDLNSFLWTIRRDPPAYLFGTIHVPYTRVWDFVPQNSKAAFQASSSVYFELDLTNPSTISGLANCQLLPHGENLQDVLPQDLYHRLKRHLEYVRLMLPHWMTPDQRGRGLYADYLFNAIAGNWERKRPVWVMLMVNSLTETDVRSRGVPVLDLHLAQEAERMKKGTGAVERVEEQCHPLNGLNFSQVLFALNQTLLQHESLRAGSWQAPYTTEDLIKHYNCGDLNAVIFNHDSSQGETDNVIPSSAENDNFPESNICCKFSETFAKVNDSPLGHFLGNNTVIDVLRQAGFEVEHIPAGQPVENPKASRYHPSSATAAPLVIEHVRLSSSSAPPPANEEDSLPPHLLLPDSISQLEEFGRQKNWHKKQYKIHRQRQFNDLWVRIEEGTTTMPSDIRMTDGLISVNPSIWFSNQVEQQPHPDLAFHHHLKSCAFESTIASLCIVSVLTAMAYVLLDLLNPS